MKADQAGEPACRLTASTDCAAAAPASGRAAAVTWSSPAGFFVTAAAGSTAYPASVPAKQLASHLGRKVEFVQDGDTWTAHVAGSVPRGSPDSRAHHLERFGQRNELTVSWQRSTAPAS